MCTEVGLDSDGGLTWVEVWTGEISRSERPPFRGPLVDLDHLSFPQVLEPWAAAAGEELELAGELLSDEPDAILYGLGF